MFDFDQQIRDLDSKLSNLFRVGTVTSLLPEACKARVVFEDRDNMESYDLQVIVKNTLKNKDYWMPDIGEPVLCVFLPIGLEAGFIIGSYYTEENQRPASTENVRKVQFSDGTVIEYDRQNHLLTIDVPEDGAQVVLNAHTKVTVNSPLIDLGESADLEPSVLGNKLASWITQELKPWLDDHQHISASPGQPSSAAKDAPKGPFNSGSGQQGGAVYSTKNRYQ